jgi:hypothetical protein
MKKILIKTILLTAFIILNSCVDLVEDPPSLYSEKFINESVAKIASAGTYAVLSNSPFSTETQNLLNSVGWVGFNQDARYQYRNTGPMSAGDITLTSMWKASYEIIKESNIAISILTNALDIDENVRVRSIAEAKFTRALAYFYLVRGWANVPLVATSVTSEEDANQQNITIAPMKNVYQAIINDLDTAARFMIPAEDIPVIQHARASKQAAQALLAQVYLTIASSTRSAYEGATGLKHYLVYDQSVVEDYYAKCKSLCDSVINGQNHFQLVSNWMSIWEQEDKNSKECIFKVVNRGGPGVGNALPVRYTPSWSKYAPWGGSHMGITYEFARSFVLDTDDTAVGRPCYLTNGNDVRFKDGLIWNYIYLDKTHVRFGELTHWMWDINNPNATLNSVFQSKGATGPNNYRSLCTNKYRDEKATTWEMGFMLPIIRMADVYLMYAEADNELNGPAADGLAKYNAVRKRVGYTDKKLSDFTSKEVYREAILWERFCEFAHEAKDFFDMTRTGTYEKFTAYLTLNNTTPTDRNQNKRQRKASDYLFPYPESETLINPGIGN